MALRTEKRALTQERPEACVVVLQLTESNMKDISEEAYGRKTCGNGGQRQVSQGHSQERWVHVRAAGLLGQEMPA